MLVVRGLTGLAATICLLVTVGWFGAPTIAVADPAADLAAAESAMDDAESRVVSAESEVDRRRQDLRPLARRSIRLDRVAERAEADVESIEVEVRDERQAAAQAVDKARADHEDEVAAGDALRIVGIVAMVMAAGLTLAGFAWGRLRKWPLGSTQTRVALGSAALVIVAGLALALVPSAPSPPEFTEEQLALASAAEGDPLDPSTPELRRARAAAAPDIAAAKSAAADAGRARAGVRRAQKEVRSAKRARTRAGREGEEAKRVVARIERDAAEEAAFREQATTIDYDQLIKDPLDFKGEAVTYTGQIFQIQEFAGESIILLSVTDEGYGFWTDNIWVDYAGEIDSAEEDNITVYGKITGSKEYETQIGGSTYVPRMTARYVDE